MSESTDATDKSTGCGLESEKPGVSESNPSKPAGSNRVISDSMGSKPEAIEPTGEIQATLESVETEQGTSAKRLALMRSVCAESGLDAFLVRGTSNIQWLSAFDNVFDDEDAHALLILNDSATLHTDSRYVEAARASARVQGNAVTVDAEHKTHATFAAAMLFPGIEEQPNTSQVRESVAEWSSTASDMDSTNTQFGAARSMMLGIEDSMTLADYRALEKALTIKTTQVDFIHSDTVSRDCSQSTSKTASTPDPAAVPALASEPELAVTPSRASLNLRETSDFVLGLRAVKDAGEIFRMRAAQGITDAAFTHIIEFMRPGMTEREIQIELEDFMVRHGATGLAFSSIVAAGANGSSPHAIPGDTVLTAGQCVVLDFGARAYGYCSDMTRTVFLGEPTALLRAAYDTIRRANEEVERALRPGVIGKDMHELAERVLRVGGFEGKMGHGLGHGVGLDIHELPSLSPRNSLPLVAGNVVTVEPGIYVPNEFGMRLEDFGVITEDGFDVFTQSTHNMVVL